MLRLRSKLLARPLVTGALASIVAIATAFACTTTTGNGSNCDPNAGFNFFLPGQDIVMTKGDSGRKDIVVQRDTAFGPIYFDVLRGPRVYGSGAWVDSIGLYIEFLPNPALADRVRLQVTWIGLDNGSVNAYPMTVRGFVGSGITAKECFQPLRVTVS